MAASWLHYLYGPEPTGLIWIGGHGDRFVGRTFADIPSAVAYAMELDASAAGGVYHRLTTLQPIERGRGTAEDSAYLPGFAMDLDLLGPGHKAGNYPQTEHDLSTLLQKADLPEPSAWVHSGGGRYPFWKLEHPADLTLPGALAYAAELSANLHRHAIAWAAELGWKVDNTSDLARVYRLPGTLNRKTDPPVRCTVQRERSSGLITYPLADLDRHVTAASSPTRATPPSTPPADWTVGTPFALPGQLTGPFVSAMDRSHTFTLDEALTFVRRKLDELRDAQDGEINNRLRDAALTLAHFGEEFWPREAAERQLYAALENTVYDARTWKAADTIRGAYADMASKAGPEYWSAVLVQPTLEQPAPPSGRLWRALLKRSEIHALPDPIPLIQDVLYRNSVTVLAGKFGTYKSFVAVSWAASLATGTPWFGHAVPHAVPVIYAAAEGAYGIRKRLDAWEAVHGPIPDDLYLIPLSVRINRPDDIAELEEIIQETRAAVLIFDTLHASTPGVDENDSGEMGAVLDVLRGLQERYGICTVLPHHTGHAGERARGSSSVEDDADISFVIRLEGEDRGPDGRRTLVHRKSKDSALLDDMELKLTLVDGTGSGYVSTLDTWEKASGVASEGLDPGQVETIAEPQDWTRALFEDPRQETKRRILQVLADAGGQVGITEAKCMTLVAERWHGGKTGKDAGQLRKGNFVRHWNELREYHRASDGEPLLTNPSGEKFAVNPSMMGEVTGK